MRKSILISLFALLNILSARAYNFEVDDIYYNIISGTDDQVEVTYKVTPTYMNTKRTDYTGSVVIPSTVEYEGTIYAVTKIGEKAFKDCMDLTSVTIPESVTSIGESAFNHCTGLTSVTIPEGVTSIDGYTFSYCTGLTSITIPESVTSVGERAFLNCSSLTSVTIPNSVTSIGDYAFYECNGMTSMTIGESVASIGVRAFQYCRSLTSVTIPNSVTSIGYRAFYDCSGLTSVTSLAETPPSCSGDDFSVHDTLLVPRGCKAAYQGAEGWKEFAVIEETPCLVTLQVNDEAMGVVTGDGEYAYGTQATLEAIPNTGYYFVKWNDDNTDNPRTLTVTQDTTLTAVFAINTYTVTVQANDADMGTVSGGDTYAFGTEATLEAIPTAGYHFVKWNDENTDNPRTLTVAGDITLTAEFAINTYTVTAQANDADMGSVTGGNEYAHGAEATLTAIPNAGYHFVKWNDDNTDNPRTLTVTCDTAFTAEFAINTFTVSVSANKSEWGNVSQSGNGTYDSASSVTITATPNEGYRFINWTKGEAVFSTQADTTFTITENLTLLANFEKIPDEPIVIKTFTLSVSANKPEWGSASQSGNGTYDSASSVTITATPNEGYRFINWTKGEAVFSAQADTTFMVTENLTLLANFEKIPDEPIVVKTFTLIVSSNNEDWGSVSQSGNGTYDSASSVTITATPNDGYRFINWTKGEAVFSAQADTTFMVTENLTLLANFEKIPDEPVANENRKDDHFRVYVQDRTIHLSEERGLVQVYNMAGQCVYNGHSTAIPVSQPGVYIVAIGSQRFKVLMR